MTTKHTREPVHDDRIGFYAAVYETCDVEGRLCGIDDMTICIEDFALMLLSVCTDDLLRIDKFSAASFGVLLRVGKLGTELLDGCLEFFHHFVLVTEIDWKYSD